MEVDTGTGLLLLGGLTLVLGGVALVGLPLAAPPLAWIAEGCAKHGVNGAPLALFGSVLFGLWIVARSRNTVDADAIERAARLSEEKGGQHDQGLILEQLASDLASTRGGMQELRVEFVYLKDAVQNATTRRRRPDDGGRRRASSHLPTRRQHGPTRRTARPRLRAQDSAVHEVMSLLRSELSQTTSSLMDLRLRIEQGIESATNTNTQTRYVDAGQEDQIDFSEVDEIEIEPGYQASPDDLEIEVELETDTTRGLGLLDDLDDQGSLNGHKTSPSIRPSIPRTNTYADMGLDDGDGAAEELLVHGALPTNGLTDDDEVDQKLATLRELMSDPDVRAALEAARHRA